MKLRIDFKEMVVKNENGFIVLPNGISQIFISNKIMERIRTFKKLEENAREFFKMASNFDSFDALVRSEHKDFHSYWENKFYTSYYVVTNQVASSQRVMDLIENDILSNYYGDPEAHSFLEKIRYYETYAKLHKEYTKLTLRNFDKILNNRIIFDIKGILNRQTFEKANYYY